MLSAKSNSDFCRALMSIDKYIEYLVITKNVSNYTVRNYRYCLARFFSFVQKTILEVTVEDINNFRLHLKRSDIGFNWATFHLIVVREFLKFCQKNDLDVYPACKIEIPKYEERPINVIDRKSLEKLFKITHPKKLISLRNTAIIQTLYSTGCRVSELVSLQRHNVSDEISIMGKGRKIRLVFLSKKARAAINKYLEIRGDKYSPLFISHGRNKGKALTKEMIEIIVRKYAQKAGVMRTHPHAIRHRFAVELLKNGAPLTAIQEMLGHSSIRTTQIYTKMTNPELKRIHATSHR